MQLKRYISIPISFIILVILNKFNQSAIAHFPDSLSNNTAKRISFNEQTHNSLRATNRDQQAYFFELGRFADSYDELAKNGFGFPTENSNYQLTTENNDSYAFTYGIPNQKYGTYKEWSGSGWQDVKEPLYSYASSILYSAESGSFQSILCVSKKIGEEKLAAPQIADGKLICPQNTEEIPS